jgi:hypothetical protein
MTWYEEGAFSEEIIGGIGEGAGDHWRVKVDCPTCGLQETEWVTGRGYVPKPEDAYPPVCPRCCYLGTPQAKVISIERLPDSSS